MTVLAILIVITVRLKLFMRNTGETYYWILWSENFIFNSRLILMEENGLMTNLQGIDLNPLPTLKSLVKAVSEKKAL